MAKPVVLRMRRDLAEPIEAARWPEGVAVRTLGKPGDKLDSKIARAAHAVLTDGFWEGGGGAPIFRKWWPALRKDKEFDPGLVFVAMERGAVIGMAQCWASSFVKDLAVHPDARRRGIGRALMLTVFAAFAERGAAHVDLKVRAENVNAQALYHSLRMRIIARETD